MIYFIIGEGEPVKKYYPILDWNTFSSKAHRMTWNTYISTPFLYCVERHQDLSYKSTTSYNNKGTVRIEGKKATSTVGGKTYEEFNEINAKFAYLLSKSDKIGTSWTGEWQEVYDAAGYPQPKVYITGPYTGGYLRSAYAKQLAIWYHIEEWKDELSKLGINVRIGNNADLPNDYYEGEPIVDDDEDKKSGQQADAINLWEQAGAYAKTQAAVANESAIKLVYPSTDDNNICNSANILVQEYIGDKIRIGPFRLRFPGTLQEVKIGQNNVDWKTVEIVQNGNVVNVNSVQSNTDFWIQFGKNDGIENMKYMYARSRAKVYGVTVDFYTDESNHQTTITTSNPKDEEEDYPITIQFEPIRAFTGNILIEKYNSHNSNKKLEGVGFKLKHSQLGWVHQENGKITYDNSSDSNATEFVTDNNGQIFISGLYAGDYQIRETSNANYGYKKKTIKATVEAGKTTKIDKDIANTQAYIKLSGYVWNDNTDTSKGSASNNLYKDTDTDNADLRMEGIKVTLKDGDNVATLYNPNTNQPLALSASTTRTDKNGRYTFEGIPVEANGDDPQLQNYHVEFEYDGLIYQNVPKDLGSSTPDNDTYITTTPEKPVENGVYEIRFAADPRYVLDVDGASKNDNADIQIWEDGDVSQQRWEIKYDGNGYYTIKSVNSGLYMNVSGQGTANGTNVIQYHDDGTDAMLWAIEKVDGYYQFRSKVGDNNNKKLYLDINGALPLNGQDAQLYEANGSLAQKFVLESIEKTTDWQTLRNGTYEIKSPVINDLGLKKSNNSDTIIFSPDKQRITGFNAQGQMLEDNNNQKFDIVYIGEGLYKITETSSGKALTVENSGNVIVSDYNESDNQKWFIKEAGDGLYYIMSQSGKGMLGYEDSIGNNEYSVSVNGTSPTFKLSLERYGENGSKAVESEADRVEFNKRFGFIEKRDAESNGGRVEYDTYRLGDVNFDGLINASDMLMIFRYSVHEIDLTNIQKIVGDLDKDGAVNAGDAAIISTAISDGTVDDLGYVNIDSNGNIVGDDVEETEKDIRDGDQGQTRYLNEDGEPFYGLKYDTGGDIPPYQSVLEQIHNSIKFDGNNYETENLSDGRTIKYIKTDGENVRYIMKSDTRTAGLNLNTKFKWGVEEIDNINLGLYTRTQPDISIQKDLDNVQLTMNGYTHTYKYEDRFTNEVDFETAFEDMSFRFGEKWGQEYTKAVYPSDIAYTDTEVAGREAKMRITYKVALKNLEPTLNAKLNLVDYYDKDYTFVGAWFDEGLTKKITTDPPDPASSPQPYEDGSKFNRVELKTMQDMDYLTDTNQFIYIQFDVNREALAKILFEGEDSLKNVVEVSSYSTFDKDGNPYAGVDKNSAPENAIPSYDKEIVDNYENDTDKAPGFLITPGEQRIMKGTVFEDSAEGDTGTNKERKGNSIYDNDEHGIGGVEVTLREKETGLIIKTTTANSGGSYIPYVVVNDGEEPKLASELEPGDITNNKLLKVSPTLENDPNNKDKINLNEGDFYIPFYIPGNYEVIYTWGGQTWTDDAGKTTTYTVQDYKGTIYKEDAHKDEMWYKSMDDKDPRYSDAIDNYDNDETEKSLPLGSRVQIDDEINEMEDLENAEEDEDGNVKVSNFIYKYTKINSTTPKIMYLGIEQKDRVDAENRIDDGNLLLSYTTQNIDFGIIERPRQGIVIDKIVKDVILRLPNNFKMVEMHAVLNDDGTPKIDSTTGKIDYSGSKQGVTITPKSNAPDASDPGGLIWIQLDRELLQGSTLEVTYMLRVENTSELDYKDRNYYIYGYVPTGPGADEKIVKMKVTELYDFLDQEYGEVNETAEGQGWEEVEMKQYTESEKPTLLEWYNFITSSSSSISVKEDGSYEITVEGETIEERGWFENKIDTWQEERVENKSYSMLAQEKEDIEEGLIRKDGDFIEYKPGEFRTKDLNASVILSNKNEISLDNSTEIVRISKNGGRTIYTAGGQTVRPESYAARISVTPNTGENRNIIPIIIIGVTSMLILIGGIILIKRKVLK